VGELPPRIEDIQVEEYDDSHDLFHFGRVLMRNGSEGEECGDAPTVVIDSSLDEEAGSLRARKLSGWEPSDNRPSNPSSNHNPNSNIEFALQSIKQQEIEEEAKAKKKKVTIMSVEEEEDLISQINEIRERIKRGETAAQQQQHKDIKSNAQF
jgi:hypothetical protein